MKITLLIAGVLLVMGGAAYINLGLVAILAGLALLRAATVLGGNAQ